MRDDMLFTNFIFYLRFSANIGIIFKNENKSVFLLIKINKRIVLS